MSLKALFKQSSKERIDKILNGDIKKTLFFIALTSIFAIMIRSVSPLLDGLIIYNFGSETGGAAISYATSLSNVLTKGIFAYSIACTAIIGHYNGRNEMEKAKKLTGQLLMLIVIFSILSIPILLFLSFSLTSDFTDIVLKRNVIQYIMLTALSLPFFTVQSVYTSVKSVFGHPEAALFRVILFIPLKLLFSFIFIIILKLDVVGAGLSNISAYFVVFIFVIYDMFIKESSEKIHIQ